MRSWVLEPYLLTGLRESDLRFHYMTIVGLGLLELVICPCGISHESATSLSNRS